MSPSCVVSRDRVPYQRDSGASACRTSPPSGVTVPLLPQALPHRALGGPAANTASLRCPGVLLRVLAAQVGVASLPFFPPGRTVTERGPVHHVACNCYQHKCPFDHGAGHPPGPDMKLAWGLWSGARLGHLLPLPSDCLGNWHWLESGLEAAGTAGPGPRCLSLCPSSLTPHSQRAYVSCLPLPTRADGSPGPLSPHTFHVLSISAVFRGPI